MKLFGSTKTLIEKRKSRNNVPSLQRVELVLVQCNLVDYQYQQKDEVFYAFTLKKFYALLLNVKPSNLVLSRTYNTQFVNIPTSNESI